MMKTIKLSVILISISFLYFTTSCDINNNVPDRTAATEQQELSEALAKLKTAGYNIDTTDLGVYYIMKKVGTGTLPQKSDTCFLIYTGFFLNGVIFDASAYHYQDSIWKFNFQENSLIPGFNDGIGLLNKGAEAEIIVPSALAYGSARYGDIPPYTPLVFSLKMRDLRPTE
ncbi:MAG: FKBP-type peptidyl-prolyl cis-trans isomerase [Bacteroidales bacterium]|nr:FKBP-type peptidyl-prolyl cis-trans isomerase [Bacteroidales bacterium]